MFTGIEEQLLEHTAATAFQLVWDSLKGVKDVVADKNAIQRGMREYARKFLARYGNVKVLNMEQPVPLSDIYVAAKWISPNVIKGFQSIQDLHNAFLSEGRRYLFQADRDEKRQDCLGLANAAQFLNVLGAPGAGKSTFLRRLGLEALRPRNAWDESVLQPLGLKAGLLDHGRSRYSHDCLPVLIELRRFRTDEIDLTQLLQNELTTCGLPDSDKLLKALLEKGRLLLLLDGVDEIPGERIDKSITHICDFVDRYSENRFVTSCRTAFYKDYFPRFRDVLLADFDDEQIASFVKNWFRSEEDRKRGVADEFLKLLADSANAAARELASTPLLLTFLCLAYDDRQRLPPNRGELYRQALDILMERWAASKRVHNEPIYRELHSRLEVEMLAEVAAPAFESARYFFTRNELARSISAFLRDELNAPKHLNADQVLDAIELQQGLIVQRAADAWSFSHLTLQEYLTAVWYVSNQQIERLVRERLSDIHWREVFILAAGVLSRGDDMLKRMQRAAARLLDIDDATWFIPLIRWADDKAAPVEDAWHGAANRAWAFHLALEHRNVSLVGTRGRALELSLDIALESILGRVPKEEFEASPAPDVLLRISKHYALVRRMLLSHISMEDASIKLEKLLPPIGQIPTMGGAEKKFPYEWLMRWIKQWAAKGTSSEKIATWVRPSEAVFDGVPEIPLKLFEEQVYALDRYLYVCQLISDCQRAAGSVSRSTWEGICQRMLTVSKNVNLKAR